MQFIQIIIHIILILDSLLNAIIIIVITTTTAKSYNYSYLICKRTSDLYSWSQTIKHTLCIIYTKCIICLYMTRICYDLNAINLWLKYARKFWIIRKLKRNNDKTFFGRSCQEKKRIFLRLLKQCLERVCKMLTAHYFSSFTVFFFYKKENLIIHPFKILVLIRSYKTWL